MVITLVRNAKSAHPQHLSDLIAIDARAGMESVLSR